MIPGFSVQPTEILKAELGPVMSTPAPLWLHLDKKQTAAFLRGRGSHLAIWDGVRDLVLYLWTFNSPPVSPPLSSGSWLSGAGGFLNFAV